MAKVAWHPGELYPRVGFLVTSLCRPPESIVAFYNGRGTACAIVTASLAAEPSFKGRIISPPAIG